MWWIGGAFMSTVLGKCAWDISRENGFDIAEKNIGFKERMRRVGRALCWAG